MIFMYRFMAYLALNYRYQPADLSKAPRAGKRASLEHSQVCSVQCA